VSTPICAGHQEKKKFLPLRDAIREEGGKQYQGEGREETSMEGTGKKGSGFNGRKPHSKESTLRFLSAGRKGGGGGKRKEGTALSV